MNYETILTAVHGDGPRKTGVVTLNRPKQLNALNDQLMDELGTALLAFDADAGIGCIIVTGSERAFAAGADIPVLAGHDFMSALKSGLISKNWETVLQVKKPVIAAVAGFALGGGCELAMMCDFIIAADTAKFGQPEIKLGLIPGAGGTQRLPRAVGKSKAMDLLLTARMMNAQEAESAGLVSRIVAADKLMEEVLAAADQINAMPGPAAQLIKELVNLSFQAPLSDSVKVERRYFHALFGTPDMKEGTDAFMNKRAANFKD